MSGDEFAQLGYLALLLVAIGGSYVVSQRRNLGQMAQQAAIWTLIILGTIAVVGMWPNLRQTITPTQTVAQTGDIIVPRGPNGHFFLTLNINDTDVRFVVDTGASEMVLTIKDAARVGIDVGELDYLGRASTANGTVRIARVRLDEVNLEGITDRNFRATVNEGEMRESLLGMTYLSRFSRIAIEGNMLVLSR